MSYVSTLTYKFTSELEMERLFSTEGVDYRRDDYLETSAGYDDTLEEVIDQATWECKAILNKLFDDEDLHNKVWIRRRATIIGCYLLSIRRGLDSQYYAEYLDALDDFRRLIEGEIFIEGLAVSNGVRVALINVSTDNRYPYMPIRADFLTSTDTDGLRFLKFYQPFYWI